ncbi:DoxX family protein [Nocardia cyriacigeorgica]|uniref:DoxX family protein n=1 Tax=Nocardia cyriacigeorgica TaxID=135487 RepID=A0A4U8VW68_9NOCA|nr:DoxX family protein [Nocardia cyriacigeorgica]MBF6093280.1 DoxX family protein [Nocardia cyriacigeorgica]MBF6100267.1 DoxX family protein [Nocardia cyriacigeorgica]MBF6157432.1 DoxX family protein [Nocardia cyriacigeorgica]MBF6196403.1 DoxX family protein [Nocardia cyriacigeorgica]MBF6318344.1 DoxX family protein [Nocardia cyriacigeorgica]
MFALYVLSTVLTALLCAGGAWMNFTRHPVTVAAAEQVQVPLSWTRPIGLVFAAGGLGVLAGFALPVVGVAAAAGLVFHFVGAIIAHLRVHDRDLGKAGGALTLMALNLAVTLAYHLG